MSVFAAEEMDKNDMELRKTIRTVWPIHAKKMENLLVPPNEGNHLMVIDCDVGHWWSFVQHSRLVCIINSRFSILYWSLEKCITYKFKQAG